MANFIENNRRTWFTLNEELKRMGDKPVETNQPIKNAHSETVPSDVSVPEPDIDFNTNNENKTKTEKNTASI